MRSPHVLLLCVLGAALLSSVLCNNALGPTTCCFVFHEVKLPRARISSYQETDPNCPKKGVVFTTIKDRQICVKPTVDWVKRIMKKFISSRHLHRAAMRSPQVLLLCVLGAALLSSVLCNNALGPENCCFDFYPRQLMKARISSYQRTDFRCPKKAVFFRTKRSSKICVDPTLPWVQRIVEQLDEESL
ncbi:C-C motif chemokine 36.1 [Limanda limanda]|uniref:C-C motif chemokine 36.1 n=1 Tax=Limanda limanda TaxID=27771 RepID=UPI0029C93701|nr:C-C motif chemokine 36.1 [Limanda limanda]